MEQPLAHAGSDFSTGRLLASDARLALALLNHGRYVTLERVFGVPREQANTLTFVLALVAAGATWDTASRLGHIHGPSRDSVFTSGFFMREAALGIGGPSARATPGFAAMLAVALASRAALPVARRALQNARETERRLRELRKRSYATAIAQGRRLTTRPGGPSPAE
jgi:hypothetical protein